MAEAPIPGGSGSAFVGIDPELMGQLRKSVKRGGELLIRRGRDLKTRFEKQGLDTSQLKAIRGREQAPQPSLEQTGRGVGDTPSRALASATRPFRIDRR